MPLLRKAALTLLARDPTDPLRAQYGAWLAGHEWVGDSALYDVISKLP